jgi:uncharacterized membrane protein YphA (DoxX/SURF4 family)
MIFLRLISRILVGSVFIFSGFVKGIDPQGFAIKLSEYFVSFGLPEWHGLALILSVLVITGEFLIGISLFIGLRMQVTAWAALIFMSYFTVLTLYIAIYNPVSDCGCFGDAIKLSNWATFYKNIFLLPFTLFIFYQRKLYVQNFRPYVEWIIMAVYAGFGMSLFLFCIQHLPIIDFRPYHVGANIPEGMIKPEGAPNDQNKTLFYYKKNGMVKEFTMDNYPWNDSSWTWVETKQILIKKGYTPPIHDFSIYTEKGTDITDSVLQNKGYSFLFIVEDLDKANLKGLLKGVALGNEVLKQGHGFYCLTATPMDYALSYKQNQKWNFPICTMDRTTLKTMIRSNPGLILIKEGTVIGQWHYNDFPKIDFVKKDMLTQLMDHQRLDGISKMIFLFILIFIVSVIAIQILYHQLNN